MFIKTEYQECGRCGQKMEHHLYIEPTFMECL